MKKFLLGFVATIVLAVVLIFVGRDLIIQAAAARVARVATGLNLSIGVFHSNLTKSTIDIRDLKIYNPPAYSGKIMFHMPQVFVAFDLGSLWARKPHLREVQMHLAVLEIERKKDGKLNLSELKPAKTKKDISGTKSSPPMNIQIDVLKLRIDKVIYKDFSSLIPLVREFDVNIDKTYANIKDVRALAPLIIKDVLRNQGLSALIGFDLGDLLQNFQASGINVADLGLDQISGLGQTAQGVVSSVADQLGSLFGSPAKK